MTIKQNTDTSRIICPKEANSFTIQVWTNINILYIYKQKKNIKQYGQRRCNARAILVLALKYSLTFLELQYSTDTVLLLQRKYLRFNGNWIFVHVLFYAAFPDLAKSILIRYRVRARTLNCFHVELRLSQCNVCGFFLGATPPSRLLTAIDLTASVLIKQWVEAALARFYLQHPLAVK